MAGTEPVSIKRLEKLARLIHEVEPELWSEHLAFVRAAGVEIGHLAAPPRNHSSVEGAAENLRKAAHMIGMQPAMENIATLLQPPCGTLPEQQWISQIVSSSGCGVLLDLHNLHANATNFSFDPLKYLDEIPLEHIRCIHIAGGRWIKSPDGKKDYLLDDHLHEVTDPVYELLAEVAARAAQPLTVILERDGKYPPMHILLAELDRARTAMAAGRQRSRRTQEVLAHAS